MEFKLTEITGVAQAITSLKMSKRNYDYTTHKDLMRKIDKCTDYRGFFNKSHAGDAKMFDEVVKEMDKLAKWGAGVGQEGAWRDDGHETILRYIDISFVTLGLHRGAQDDLDAHARRFDSRIVRASTRLGNFATGERSDWYKDRIRSVEDMLHAIGEMAPVEYTDKDGVVWKYTSNGYVRKDIIGTAEEKDAARGNHPLSIPGDAIWKINFQDLRHVYMRRNQFTHANPELRIGIEQLADQIEEALPGDLGKLIRYDYALIPYRSMDGNQIIPASQKAAQYGLVHVMDIKKVYVPRNGENK